jgi:hypothetical protein
MTNGLLPEILDAHNGLAAWQRYARVTAAIVRSAGFFMLKGLVQGSSPRRMTVWLQEERSSVSPYDAAGQRRSSDAPKVIWAAGSRAWAASKCAPFAEGFLR